MPSRRTTPPTRRGGGPAGRITRGTTAPNRLRRFDRWYCRRHEADLRAADPPLVVDEEYVLVVPTYGGGSVKGAVPKQVIAFLNNPDNRALCRGVIASGNTNFGQAYCLAGDIIASKLGVPFLYRYELLGTPTDVARVKEGLEDFWQTR